MPIILQLTTSLFSEQGQSSRLAQAFTDAWQLNHPGDRIIRRDLAQAPVPHLSAEHVRAFALDAAGRNPAEQAMVATSDALIDELKAADRVVLGLPMYNFGIPSTLKAYFDHIARAGVTFRYGADGPVGLLADRPVYVFATRGGLYQGTPQDTQSRYLRDFLNFLGIRSIEFIYAEGLARSGPQGQEALRRARGKIGQLAA